MKEVIEVVFIDIKPYSESSLWVCFFSEKDGLQNGIIKGGKKKKVKPLVLGLYQATVYSRHTSGLVNILQIERSEALEETYNSPVKILIAFFVAESIKSFLYQEVVDGSFFKFIKGHILGLNKEKRTQRFPVLFLASLITYSGHKPLKNEDERLFSLDLMTGVFNAVSPSDKTIHDASLVQSIYDSFYNIAQLNKGLERKVFDLLLEYCSYHIPGYNSNKSVEVIRETLYD